jgi:hypothetical protein
MRAAPSPRGLLAPPDVPSAGGGKPECSNMQLEQLQVYIKQAVVRYFCRDVVGVRRKCAPSCFSLTDAPVSISEALKGISDRASKIYDHVTTNYRPPSKFGEVRTVSPHITMFESIYAEFLKLTDFVFSLGLCISCQHIRIQKQNWFLK